MTIKKYTVPVVEGNQHTTPGERQYGIRIVQDLKIQRVVSG